MKTQLFVAMKCAALALGLSAGVAQAWHVSGKVVCDANGNQQIDTSDTAVSGATLTIVNGNGSFTQTVATGADGSFRIDLPHTADSFRLSLSSGSPVLLPAGGSYAFSLTDAEQFFEQAYFLLDCSAPPPPPPPPPEEGDCGKITGGGWILSASGAKITFSVSGGTKGQEFWGSLNLVDHGTGMHIRSTSVTGYELDPTNENGRTIRYNVVIGSTDATAIVHVVDAGEPGRHDTFSITCSNGYSAQGELGGARSGGGNIQLHACPPGKKK